jgi:ribose transport system substrate-binding protein
MSLLSRRLVNSAAVSLILLASGTPVFSQTKTLIGVALPQDDNPFYIVMLKGIRARAAELGWDVASVSSNEDKMKQIGGVQDLIARGVKGILISPIDAVGVNAAYTAASDAKIPIISLARGTASPAQTYYVPMDEKQVGRDIAEWTAKKIGGEGKVALILGPAGAPTFRNLAAGYMEVIEKNPKIAVAVRTDGPLTRERGLHSAEDALVAQPDLKAIYCANDDVALGAMQAVVAAGKQGQILVTGMNGVPPALKSIKEGNLAMTVELNPYQWGSLGVEVMKAFLDGTPPKSQTFVPHKLIDKDNIDEVLKAK